MTTAAPRCSVLLRHAFTHSGGCLRRGRSLGACDALSGLAERAGLRVRPPQDRTWIRAEPEQTLCGSSRVSPFWHRSQFSQFSQFPTWLSCFGLTRELNEWIVVNYGNKYELWRHLVATFGRTRFPCQKPPEEPLENGALRNFWTVFSSKIFQSSQMGGA